MHSYLKSIGFSGINGKKEVDRILSDVILHYDEKTVVEDRKKTSVCGNLKNLWL